MLVSKFKLNNIINEVAKREGKKHQCSVGDVREVVSELKKLLLSNNEAKKVFLHSIGVTYYSNDTSQQEALLLKKTKNIGLGKL